MLPWSAESLEAVGGLSFRLAPKPTGDKLELPSEVLRGIVVSSYVLETVVEYPAKINSPKRGTVMFHVRCVVCGPSRVGSRRVQRYV